MFDVRQLAVSTRFSPPAYLWTWALACCAFALLALIAYYPLVGQQFLGWDDDTYVTSNPQIQALNWDTIQWMFLQFHASNWHPLTWLSLAADYAIWGLDPLPFKLHNLLLHLLCALMVVVLARRFAVASLGRDAEIGPINAVAWIAGALFFLHPQHVEAVAWISERKELLSTLFYLLTVYAYWRFVAGGSGRWYGLSLFFTCLAMLAKPMAVSLPIALVLLDLYLQPVSSASSTWRLLWSSTLRKWPLFGMAAVTMLFTVLSQSPESFTHAPLTMRVANAFYALVFYPFRMLVPLNLSPLYPFPEWIVHPDIRTLVPPLILAGIGTLAVVRWRAGHKGLLLALLFYGAALLPVIGIVKVGMQAVADRYAYLSTIPIYLSLPWIWARFRPRQIKLPVTLILAGTLAGAALLTSEQCRIWNNDLTLWEAAIERDSGRTAFPRLMLGEYYLRQGDAEAALEQFKLAQSTAEELLERVRSLYFLARLDASAGRRETAMEHCRQIADIDPNDSVPLVWAGDCAADLGAPELGLGYIEKALLLDPDQAVIFRAARLNQDAGNHLRARDLAALVLEVEPDDIKVLTLLAESNAALGDSAAAKKYRQAIEAQTAAAAGAAH